jgi:hypothetical protein
MYHFRNALKLVDRAHIGADRVLRFVNRCGYAFCLIEGAEQMGYCVFFLRQKGQYEAIASNVSWDKKVMTPEERDRFIFRCYSEIGISKEIVRAWVFLLDQQARGKEVFYPDLEDTEIAPILSKLIYSASFALHRLSFATREVFFKSEARFLVLAHRIHSELADLNKVVPGIGYKGKKFNPLRLSGLNLMKYQRLRSYRDFIEHCDLVQENFARITSRREVESWAKEISREVIQNWE